MHKVQLANKQTIMDILVTGDHCKIDEASFPWVQVIQG